MSTAMSTPLSSCYCFCISGVTLFKEMARQREEVEYKMSWAWDDSKIEMPLMQWLAETGGRAERRRPPNFLPGSYEYGERNRITARVTYEGQ